MKKVSVFCVLALIVGMLFAGPVLCGDAVNVILKNSSSASVEVELIDQYGGNFTATIDSGMSQNQTLKVGSEVKVSGSVVHVASAGDEGEEIVVAGP